MPLLPSEASDPPMNEPTVQTAPTSTTLAPVWHTVLLVAFIFAVSFAGIHRHSAANRPGSVNRLLTYGATAGLQLLHLGD